MTDQLKPCPFCGEPPQSEIYDCELLICCNNQDCLEEEYPHPRTLQEWNTRHIPEGYKLVPIEPTEAMRKAAWDQHYCNNEGALTLYKAMLEAADEQ